MLKVGAHLSYKNTVIYIYVGIVLKKHNINVSIVKKNDERDSFWQHDVLTPTSSYVGTFKFIVSISREQ